MVAAWLRWADRADQVWLIPTFQHAFSKPLNDFEARVQACEALAAVVGDFVKVSGIEAGLPRPSYTVETLEALAVAHPEHQFRLVLGADNLELLPQWRDWAKIQRDFAPIVVGRGDRAVEGAPSFPNISSTEVRRRLQSGEAVDHLLPPMVLRAWLAR